ncbi:hypothetical protein, partial [uncultured Cardiobacterium sp.]|uniref:hypothetical protein n=1 Tax=uncultured Cardiobacterium sp. TaxID=417619 RepID=UPI0026301320
MSESALTGRTTVEEGRETTVQIMRIAAETPFPIGFYRHSAISYQAQKFGVMDKIGVKNRCSPYAAR